MENDKTQVASKSRAIQWGLATLVAYIIKMLGLPLLPDDVSQEFVTIISAGLDLFIPAGISAIMWFRYKATKIIEGIF